MTVSALWSSDTGAAGVEPVDISLVPDQVDAIDLNLETLAAQGAGPAWRATTASAAVQAVMLAGADPAEVDLSFGITGPIDGPSAGAALTVGVLALLNGAPVRSDVTVTGTVSPDGSIGPVGDVAVKVDAAAAAGMATVLVPTGSAVPGPAGVQVVEVDSVREAYRWVTGETLVPDAAGPESPVGEAAVGVGEARGSGEARGNAAEEAQVAAALVSRLRDRMASASVPSDVLAVAASSLREANRALRAGESSRAYALAFDGYTQLERAIGDSRARAWSRRPEAAQRRTAALLNRLIERSAAVTRTLGDWAADDPHTALSVPVVAEMSVFAGAVLREHRADVRGSDRRPVIVAAMRAAHDQRVTLDVLVPDSMRFVGSRGAVPAGAGAAKWQTGTAEFLHDYTELLLLAARANDEYARTALPCADATCDRQTTAWFLRRAARGLPGGEAGLQEEVRDSGVAVANYLAAAIKVARAQAFGWYTTGVSQAEDPESPMRSAQVDRTLAAGSASVLDSVGALESQGVGAALPAWWTRWGVASVPALESEGRTPAGQVRAYRNNWHSAVSVAMLGSAVDRGLIGTG